MARPCGRNVWCSLHYTPVHSMDLLHVNYHVKPLNIEGLPGKFTPIVLTDQIRIKTMSKSLVKVFCKAAQIKTTGKAIARRRKFEARKTRALSVRGNKRKYQEMVNLYGLTEKMAVKLLTGCKL